jgi:hypothetical protein
MRFAALILTALFWPMVSAAQDIIAARYTDPTDRYPHGVLGDGLEWGALELTLVNGSKRQIELPQDRVFEDLEPRLADIDLDGDLEVVSVESHQLQGARLAIYDADGLVAANPYIGTRFRWLAPVAIGDLDEDGSIEIAYVDRPHLTKTLRVWRFSDSRLTEVASLEGVTNHKIGEDFISGGLRECGEGPEMIVASWNWRSIVSVRLRATKLIARELGAFTEPQSFAAVLACQ